MIIKGIQLSKIGAEAEINFIKMLAQEVRQRFRINEDEDRNLLDEIRQIIMEARNFEFEFDEDIEQYVYLKFGYPLFRKRPYPNAILEMLRYPDRHPDVKITELITYFENQ